MRAVNYGARILPYPSEIREPALFLRTLGTGLGERMSFVVGWAVLIIGLVLESDLITACSIPIFLYGLVRG
jgi:hypothetical protein